MKPILVVGDSMLDRYWEGVVERISPEAPVPILRVTNEYCRAGGAANVALNIKALGSEVALLTVMGPDSAGHQLRDLLAGVELSAVGSRTTQKIRGVCRHQQVYRTDFDERPSQQDLTTLGHTYLARRADDSVVVFSDYGKGSLENVSRMIRTAFDHSCLTLVDPKGSDWKRYEGAFMLKPNEAEVRAVVGAWSDPTEFRDKCAALRESLDLGHLLVTLGDRGMVDFSDEGVYSLRTEAQDVYDVTGAGDTVLATMAHALANGSDYRAAVRMANKAAGVVVGKFGTATVSRDELA